MHVDLSERGHPFLSLQSQIFAGLVGRATDLPWVSSIHWGTRRALRVKRGPAP